MGDSGFFLQLQGGTAVLVLSLLWLLETWIPFAVDRPQRLRHAARNLGIAGINLLVIGLLFAAATAAVAAWAEKSRLGLLHQLSLPPAIELPLALVLFDGWMYLWHRANHAVPLLWRFHRMHHSDPAVDVTTALRFHVGEITLSSLLRLALIPLLGLELWQVILYETLLLPVIAFHHSNVAFPERWDRWLRTVIVSPGMHRVHHSRWQPETDSNFASIFSWWDRLAGTLRLRRDSFTDDRTARLGSGAMVPDPSRADLSSVGLSFGLEGLDSQDWQTLLGLLATPFREPPSPAALARSLAPGRREHMNE